MIINAITNEQIRRVEYSFGTEGYLQLIDIVGQEYGLPSMIGVEGEIYSLYFTNAKKPKEIKEEGVGYALKINILDGTIKRKVYHEGNTSGVKTDFDVVVTGEFLDEIESYTLYHGEGVTLSDLLVVSKPYKGTTYKNGEITRITNYTKE